jgi:Serine/threonine protein kinase
MISEPALDRLSAMFQGPDVTGTRYQLLSILGRGGMGVVYLARDTVLDREVALKIVERPSEDVNEARILARLEHPGIVPVHDFGELPDGRLFYAMKRVKGDRLDRWMASSRDLPERLGVFLRVCETVAFAHAAWRRPPRSETGKRDGRGIRRGAGSRLGRRSIAECGSRTAD